MKLYKGIFCILGSAFFFALMNLFINLAGDLPVIQKAFFRNAVALIFSGIVLFRSYEKGDVLLNKKNFPALFLRAFAGTIGFVCNFYAVDRMNISDASMLNKLAPFFVIIFSAIFLKEKADGFQWFSVVVAFLGSLFVIKPSFGMEVVPAIVGVVGGLGAGIAYTCIRKLRQFHTKGPFIVFFFSAFSCLVLGPIMLFQFEPMTLKQVIFLLLTGLAASGGQFCVTTAYIYAPAGEISVYDYSQVIFAAILGFLFLGQMPDYLSFAGYFIIIGIAVAMYIRQHKRNTPV